MQLACQLPGLPQTEPSDLGVQDMNLDLSDQDQRPLICVPNLRVCQGASVEVCDADGRSFGVEACANETFCQKGRCLPITNTCEDGQTFTLSTRDVLFDIKDDLKPTTASVILLNCGAESLFVRKAAINTPLNKNQDPIFSFERTSPQGVELQPGTPLEMKVAFRPRRMFETESGELFLSIDAGGEIAQKHIALKTRSWCLSTQPNLNLGLVPSGERISAQAKLYNCGTMPITVAGVDSTAINPDEAFKAPTIQTNFEQTLDVLAPGQTKNIELEFQQFAPGPVKATLSLIIPEQDAKYLPPAHLGRVQLSGYVYNSTLPCVDQPHDPPPLIDPLFNGESELIHPMRAHVFDTAQPNTNWQSFVEQIDAPSRQNASVFTHQMDVDQFWLLPLWVGIYRFRQTLIHKTSGARSCQSIQFEREARPSTPLYVELSWQVDDDPILGDQDSGVNMDLHVRASQMDGSKPQWGQPTDDCFAPVETLWSWPCQNIRALLLGASRFGQYPEVFILEEDQPVRLDLGVQLINQGFFPQAVARVRVWRYGILSEVFEQIGQRPMSSPSGFWVVGGYDLVNDLAIPLDFYFSKGIPQD